MSEVLKRDENHVTVVGAVTDDVSKDIIMLRVDPATYRLLVDAVINDPIVIIDPIEVTQGTSPWVVSGTVAVTQSTSPWVVSGTVAATQSGTWSVGRTWTLASGSDSVTVTGSVSITGTTTISGTVSTKTALTASSPTAATVGVASAQIVAANANRKGLVLINTSNNVISLAFGATAVLNSGITLVGRGGTYVMDEYTFNTSAVNAIASSASSNLTIQEYS